MAEQIHWENYRHSEFLKSLPNDNLKYVQLFFKKPDSYSSNEVMKKD